MSSNVPTYGDWERRTRGLEAFMRIRDWVEWDVLRAEMLAGCVATTPKWAVAPYGVLRAYGLQHKRSLGGHVSGLCEHPICFLWHGLELGYGGSSWPAAVTSAYAELVA